MNSRIEAADGKIRFLVDPAKCPHTVMNIPFQTDCQTYSLTRNPGMSNSV